MKKKTESILETIAYESDQLFLLHYNFYHDTYPNHWHDAVEIIMPTESTYTVEVYGRPHDLEEFDIMVLPPGELHLLRAPQPKGTRLILQFDLRVLSTVKGFINAAYAYTKPLMITPQHMPELHEHLKRQLLDIMDEHRHKRVYYEVAIVNKIVEITVQLSRWRRLEDTTDYDSLIRRREHVAKMNECIDYIDTHFKDNLSLDMVAYAAGFSKFHFTRWFKQYIGMSFNEYLTKIRIHHAESLLLSSSAPVTVIAMESGFQSTVTFNRLFKEHKKCTPTGFRNYHLQNRHATSGDPQKTDKDDPIMAAKRQMTMKINPLSAPGTARVHDDLTFSNPFLWMDVPDPDVIRVGDTYYMVSTTMYFSPHCPIMKSHDLVNWEIVNYTCDILDDSDACALRNGESAYGKGTWAASIRYHNGTFYVTAASFTTGKTYIFATADIENGPWRRHTLDQVHHDQSLLFDDDGRVYLVSGAGSIHIIELTGDASAVKPDGLDCLIIDAADVGGKTGLPAEGSHFYKINGWYYIFLIAWPQTGTNRRIELCYRAKHIEGPYEGRVVLDDTLGFKNMGVAQGGIVDTPEGDWYAMLFQDHGAVGRIPVLLPVTWADGWPVLGVEGRVPERMPLPKKGQARTAIVMSDEFYPHPVAKRLACEEESRYQHAPSPSPDQPLKQPEEELLANGHFTEGTAYWENTEFAQIAMVTDDTLHKPVLFVSGRISTGSGPKQYITGKMTPGCVYQVSARVKYMAGPPTKRFIISLYRTDSWESIQNMGEGVVKRGAWGELKGTYTLPADSQLSNVSVFIETPWTRNPKREDDLLDFYVESVSVIAKPPARNTHTMRGENDFNGSCLALPWQWNHNPDHNLWSLTERPGYLRLKAGYLSRDMVSARNTLTQRTFGPVCAGITSLDTGGMQDGDVAGLAALQDIYGYVGVRVANGVKYIVMVNAASGYPQEIETIPFSGERIYLQVDFDFTQAADKARFFYSTDEVNWQAIGDTLPMRYKLTHFTGYRFALFYYATQLVGGYADFDYLRVSDRLVSHDENVQVLHASFEEGTVNRLGVHNEPFELTVRMDALPEGTYKGLYMSMPVPEPLTITDVAFCRENINGDTAFTFLGQRLCIAVTGEAVSFTHAVSDLFARLIGRVQGFVREDTQLTLHPDYIYVDGGDAVYPVHAMNAQIHLTAVPINAKAKWPGYANPLVSHRFGADPWAMPYQGRVYLYLTGDTYEYNDHGRIIDNTYGKINTITVLSSADFINWTDHGEIKVAGPDGAAKWAAHSWAPCVACKPFNGKDKFFLYFANDASNIGVLTADSPTGPWSDPLNAPIIHRGIPGVKGVTWCFDPAVLVDDDGTGYLYFGGGLPSHSQEDILHPRTARVIRLSGDMLHTEGEAVTIDAPALFEDSGINKINGRYYYSYCSNFAGQHPAPYPPHGEIAYMVSDSPMGPFTYAGTFLKNPQHFFHVGGNNHHCVFTFQDEWYVAYHAQTLGQALGTPKGYRSPHINRVSFYPDHAIMPVQADRKGVTLPVTLNPYEKTDAVTFAWQAGLSTAGRDGAMYVTDIHNGDWLAAANVDFGDDIAVSFTARVASATGGAIEIRLDSPQGEKVGELGVGATGGEDRWATRTCEVSRITGTHHVFFLFSGDSDRNLFNFDHWFFSEK